MRLIVTADLHYDIARSMAPTEQLAARVNRHGGDALLIVGDACGRDPDILRRCLALFDAFPGRVFYVAGNHDLWTYGGSSLERYERELADVCREAGAWYLDERPYIRDGIALVGSIGWYDYSFRQDSLGIPLRFYERKVAPGAAARLDEFRHLVDGHDDVTPSMLAITTRWMDGAYVRLPMTDIEFTKRIHDRLAEHLRHAAGEAERIVVAMHHLPFEEMVRRSGRPNWDFANAYMGSRSLGELLLSVPKVSHVFCGHTHFRHRVRCGHIECVNVGSTYIAKRCEVLEVG